MSTCSTCKHWTVGDRYWDPIIAPEDPDTWEPMVMPFEVKVCKHPELLFCERPVDPAGFAVADGSTYMANFYTGPDFGCIKHEAKE